MSARLTVDLAALERNIDHVRGLVAPAELMLVVKDDAYGHDVERVVPCAVARGITWIGAFDVATAAVVRRIAGDGIRIFVWVLPEGDDVTAAVAMDLDLGVGDAALLEDVAEVARTAGAVARVHLKIDTGLHRNGIRPEEWPAVVRRARALEQEGRIDVVGVWSHIAEASDAEDDAARALFDSAVDDAREAGLRPRLRHLAASAAGTARAEFRYDMVRVGAFCYGIAPAGGPDARALGVTPVATLTASVTAVTAESASVDIGMLDGLPSSLGGRVEVGTPGGPRRLLHVGETSSVEPWPGARAGDDVRIYGPGEWGETTATGLAEAIGTIGEEIAVRLSPGIPRENAETRPRLRA